MKREMCTVNTVGREAALLSVRMTQFPFLTGFLLMRRFPEFHYPLNFKLCFPLLPLNLAPSTVREVSIPPDKVASYSIEVRWLPPAKLNGKIGYYFYYWETSAGQTTAKRFVIPGSVHYKLVSGLRPFTNYTFSVVPYNLRKNLSGQPFYREGQTSATGMYFTAFTRTFIYDARKNPSSS